MRAYCSKNIALTVNRTQGLKIFSLTLSQLSYQSVTTLPHIEIYTLFKLFNVITHDLRHSYVRRPAEKSKCDWWMDIRQASSPNLLGSRFTTIPPVVRTDNTVFSQGRALTVATVLYPVFSAGANNFIDTHHNFSSHQY